jgi:hypothetical protein
MDDCHLGYIFKNRKENIVPHPPSVEKTLPDDQFFFFFQFCDIAQVTIAHKYI